MTDDRRERQRRLRWEEKEVDAAARARRGFELAEAGLGEAAETGVTWVDPVRAAFPVESEDGPGST